MELLKKLRKKRVGFWAGDQNNFQFLDPLIEDLKKRYRIKKNLFSDDPTALGRQMKKQDLCWFEWGNGPIVAASQQKKTRPIINRIHRYELYSESPDHINWEHVDKLLFSSPSMHLKFESKFSDYSNQVDHATVPIGVDTTLFKYAEKTITKQLIYVGRIHPHKNPSLLLQIFSKLLKKDSEYMLTIIGGFADELFEEYYNDQVEKLGIKDNISFIGQLSQEEIVPYLQDADFFLITSIIEGLSQASLEAMSCGVRPVIFNYYGAEYGYPPTCIFNTVDDAVQLILQPKITRIECRKIIEEGFTLEQSRKKIAEIIEELL